MALLFMFEYEDIDLDSFFLSTEFNDDNYKEIRDIASDVGHSDEFIRWARLHPFTEENEDYARADLCEFLGEYLQASGIRTTTFAKTSMYKEELSVDELVDEIAIGFQPTRYLEEDEV